MISQELINAAVDQWSEDCYWSFVLRVDTLSIVFVSSVMSACCKLFFCHDIVKNVAAGIDFSEYFTYQLQCK